MPFQVPLVIVELLILIPTILAPIPPTFKLPPIPTPPETVNAPDPKPKDAVECEILTTAAAVSFLRVDDPLTLAPVAA